MGAKADQKPKAIHADIKNFELAFTRLLESHEVWTPKEKRQNFKLLNALIANYRSKCAAIGGTESSAPRRRPDPHAAHVHANGAGALRKSA